MTDCKTREGCIVYEARVDLEKVEALWGPPPWELNLGGFYPPEVMEHITAVNMDGTRFERAEPCR